jgi:nucleoside-diphosphate-sugar epimerase
MTNVIVTGVTGKSGRFFYEELRSNADKLTDYAFFFIVRNRKKAEKLLTAKNLNQTICAGSAADTEFVSSVFNHIGGGTITLLHIAGIMLSEKLVEVAVKHNVNRLILVHTTGIYSKYKAAGEVYRQIEARIEKMVEGKNITLTYLRPTMIYGNIHDGNVVIFMKMVDKLRLFPVVDHATYALQPVWCGDLGKAYYQVLTHPDTATKRGYNLSGGRPILLIDMFKVMAKYLGVKNTFVSVPFPIAYAMAWVLYIVTFGKADFRERVQRLVEPRVFSYEDAAADFGYNPVPFEEGVKAEVEEYLAAKKK